VARIDLGRQPAGRKLTAAVHCVWPTGQYEWRVIASDPTGHRTAGAADTLRVLPDRGRSRSLARAWSAHLPDQRL
jgi:hypothetical protein